MHQLHLWRRGSNNLQLELLIYQAMHHFVSGPNCCKQTSPSGPLASLSSMPSRMATSQPRRVFPAATIVVAVMLLTGCLSPEQARRAIRWVSAS